MSPTRRAFLGSLGGLAAGYALAPVLRAAEASGKPLGLALCGLGNYSNGELSPALLETKHVKLVAAITGTRAKGEKLAKLHGFDAANIYSYDQWDKVAANKDIDIVYVVTPPGVHAQNVIDASMLDLKSANDLALQQINQQASGARAFGGSRQGVAEALQRSQAAQGAGRMSADLRNQSYNQAVAAMQADQGRQMQASLANQQAGMTAGAANQSAQMQAALANQQAGIGASGQQLTAANSLAGLGAQAQAANQADISQLTQAGMLQQQQTQSSLDDAYRRWAEERNYPLEGLNMRIGATSSAPVPMSSTQTSKSSFNPMSLIGPAIGLAGMFAGSDERMKTDISRLPEPDEETALPLYAYRYKGDPKTYPKVVGPMAQDIQEEYPDEVKKIGGRLAVNLGFGPMQRTFG